ncbi:MAG: alpha-ketoglutarate-dependent dioxygenase AlkB [Flavobacteriia bacterium]|nr:alpha-ketoglutarate-dependent dioxygenase AlkB [Flavobacteriia bacterium]
MKIPEALQNQLEFYGNVMDDSQELLERLQRDIQWNQREIQMFGKVHLEPRKVAWHGDSNARYIYSGIENHPEKWTPELIRVKTNIETIAGTTFNSVLLNLYRDGNDSMGYHSDDEPELGQEPIIASLSLGAERKFNLKNKDSGELISLLLPHNSLLVMKGRIQDEWKHAIPKTKRDIGPRINLTFRKILHR